MGDAGADRLYGGYGGDLILGGAGPDQLSGGPGDDTLDPDGVAAGDDEVDGGAGRDTVSYFESTSVHASLATDALQETGGAGADAISGVEVLEGSEYADLLTAAGAGTTVYGRGGDDVLISSGSGGEFGGGTGRDVVRFAGATPAVRVSLDTAEPQNTLGAGTVRLFGVEGVDGSQFDDVLIGSRNDSVRDRLTGRPLSTLCAWSDRPFRRASSRHSVGAPPRAAHVRVEHRTRRCRRRDRPGHAARRGALQIERRPLQTLPYRPVLDHQRQDRVVDQGV